MRLTRQTQKYGSILCFMFSKISKNKNFEGVLSSLAKERGDNKHSVIMVQRGNTLFHLAKTQQVLWSRQHIISVFQSRTIKHNTASRYTNKNGIIL